jgi:two-component system sensor histidine kinase PilS (NtrC family)
MMLDRSLPLTPRKALAFVNGFRALMLLVLLFMSLLQGSKDSRWSAVAGASICGPWYMGD